MNIRLIAFDLDGTLLNSGKTVSPRTKAALTRAAEHGVVLVPATGRLHRDLPADVASLMSGERADMVWIDPPYNVDYSGKAGKIRNDKMSAADFELFLGRLMGSVSDVLTDGVWLAGKGHASARDWYRKTQMPVFAYSSLARGFFAGKVTDAETASQYLDALSMRAYGCERNYARARRCIELAREKGAAPAQVALSWVFRQGLNVFAITGTSKAERIRQNIDAFFLDLSKEECRYLCGEE